MDKFDRMQALHRIFKSRRYPVSKKVIAEEWGCVERTVERAIDNLLDRWNAPLVEKKGHGWYYDDPTDSYELPGLWLTSQELVRLNSLLLLIGQLDDELLSDDMSIMSQQIEKLLSKNSIDPQQLQEKIKILPSNKYNINLPIFDKVHTALLAQKQLQITYQDYLGKQSQRSISPQQLVYYQENWYLDSYCHKRKALRQFKLANIETAVLHENNAIQIPVEEIKKHFASSYGIFAGKPKHMAELKFINAAAAEAASLQWHPEQEGEWKEAEYFIRFPYSDDRELQRNILKYGDSIEVLAPESLKNKIKLTIESMREKYA